MHHCEVSYIPQVTKGALLTALTNIYKHKCYLTYYRYIYSPAEENSDHDSLISGNEPSFVTAPPFVTLTGRIRAMFLKRFTETETTLDSILI